MSVFLQPILSYLLLYKYVALFGVTFLAALAMPLPSAPSLMAAAAFAGQGYLSLPAVIATASLGNVAGDVAGYFFSRRYGKPVLYAIGLRKVLESPTYNWVENEITHYRAPVVFFSRANVLTTISVNIIAGLSKMPFQSFLLYDMTGEVAQVLLYAAIGYSFGSNWQSIYDIFGKFTLVLALLILLAMTILIRHIQQKLMQRRKKHIATLQNSK